MDEYLLIDLPLPAAMTHLRVDPPSTYTFGLYANESSVQSDMPSSLLQHLTSLTVDWDWAAHLKLLKKCTSLETLKFDLDGGVFEVSAMRASFYPGCKHSTSRTFISDQFKDFRFPALRKLCFMLGREVWFSRDGAWCSGSSSSTLEPLSVTNRVFGLDSVFDALKGLTCLTHLTLDDAIFDIEIFSRNSSQSLVSRLNALDLLRLPMAMKKLPGLNNLLEEAASSSRRRDARILRASILKDTTDERFHLTLHSQVQR